MADSKNVLSLHVSNEINAPIERVFDAWLNPVILTQFILPMPGMPQPAVEVDAKVGGKFKIIMQVGENKIPHTGEYLEINRPDKLVFTWGSPVSTEGSTVTINFIAITATKTKVELNHTSFIDEEARSNHEGGWTNILESLKQLTLV